MKFENVQIKAEPLDLGRIRKDGLIRCQHTTQDFALTVSQLEFLSLLTSGVSVRDIAYHFYNKRIAISYRALNNLLEFLVNERLIQNPELKAHYSRTPIEPECLLESLKTKIFGPANSPINVQDEIKNLPFFRSLKPEILKLLLSRFTLVETPPKITVCRAGQQQRTLFVLLRGQASVYRPDSKGRRQKVATLPAGSLFGEAGFFLGQSRGADVVTDEDSLIMQIKYVPEIFDGVVKTDKASGLQHRIWAIHALLNSEVFSQIPQDCFDALIFAGRIKRFNSGERLLREGEIGNTCYILVQGSASVSQRGRAIRTLSPGDSFGEVALIKTGGYRSASVHTNTEILALEIPANGFYELLAGNLPLACEFERFAVRRLREDVVRKTG